MWTPPSANEPASHLSNILDIVDKSIKVLAVLIGSGWAYLNYVRGRTFKRRLEPSISGITIRNKGNLLLSGVARVKNVGLSKVLIQQEGTAIEVLSHVIGTTEGNTARLVQKTVSVREVFKVHGWIEPGEQIEESFLILVPKDDDAVAFGMCLRIVSEHIEWNADSVVEIVPVESSLVLAAESAVLASESALFPFRKQEPRYLVQNYENKKRTEDIENKKHAGDIGKQEHK